MNIQLWKNLAICSTCCVTFGPVESFAAILDQNFDTIGSSYASAQYNASPGPAVTAGGPTGSFMRLANAGIGGQANEIAFDLVASGPSSSIDLTFSFRIGGGSRADGFGIGFLNTLNFGTSGATQAFFSEEPNLDGSLGIGMDVFNNGWPPDPNNNHVSLHYNGVWLNSYNAVLDLGDNVWHQAQIRVDLESSTVQMSLDSVAEFSAAVAGLTPYQTRLAFSARTGGFDDNFDLDNIHAVFTPIPEPEACSLATAACLAALCVFARRIREKSPKASTTTYGSFNNRSVAVGDRETWPNAGVRSHD